MKRCPICGKTYPDKLRFCTRCGTSLEAVEQSQEVPKQNANDLNQAENVNLGSNNREFYEKKTVSKRLSKLWGKLSLFSKIFAIICVIFVILFFVALILNKASACVIIVLAIVLAVVSLLMHKGVIRLKKAWISGVALGLAVLLILPYAKALSIYTKGAERFEWDDIKLYRLIPETDSNLANISANTEKSLDMDVYKVSNGDYSDYIEECESFGFRYETVKSENSYEAYNKDGSSLSLHYDNKKKLLSIEVSVGEALGTLEWSDSEYASLIPIPSSDVGKVTQDNDSGFKVTVGDVTIDDYDEYVDLCIENGFDDGAVREDTEFSARNSAGNRLTVEYKGYKTMYIAVTQVEYEVKIKVDCHENYMFSKYDVKMYLDGEDLGEIKHGASKDVTLYLASGEYTLKFVQNDDTATEYLSDGEIVIKVTRSQTFAYEIRCTSTSIDVEKLESKEEQESEETTAAKKTTTEY
ncbi:MAG: hypothetical protein LUI06_06140 [Ruminococcus sp.]|nr:hypothetical protein [Ruminococcus sp.]